MLQKGAAVRGIAPLSFCAQTHKMMTVYPALVLDSARHGGCLLIYLDFFAFFLAGSAVSAFAAFVDGLVAGLRLAPAGRNPRKET